MFAKSTKNTKQLHYCVPQQNKKTTLCKAGVLFDANMSLKYYGNASTVKRDSYELPVQWMALSHMLRTATYLNLEVIDLGL